MGRWNVDQLLGYEDIWDKEKAREKSFQPLVWTDEEMQRALTALAKRLRNETKGDGDEQ